MQLQKFRKVYIDVYTMMRKDGMVIPKFFIWEDGEKYTIDRVVYITPAASLKVGGRGIRYTAMINGQERYGGLDTYLYTLMGRTIRLWVFAFKDKYIYTEEKNEF